MSESKNIIFTLSLEDFKVDVMRSYAEYPHIEHQKIILPSKGSWEFYQMREAPQFVGKWSREETIVFPARIVTSGYGETRVFDPEGAYSGVDHEYCIDCYYGGIDRHGSIFLKKLPKHAFDVVKEGGLEALSKKFGV